MLAELLIENSCLDRVFFGNSGAEANEGAMKLARRYGKINRDGAYEIITALNSFHGRTMATVAATGQPHYQEAFQPLQPGFVHVDYNDVEAIMNATTDRTAAVMLEPVQGEGGVNVAPRNYLRDIAEECRSCGALLILDEIQTGIGRSGRWFAFEHDSVTPDILLLGKGLGGGFPVAGILCTDGFASTISLGDHGGT